MADYGVPPNPPYENRLDLGESDQGSTGGKWTRQEMNNPDAAMAAAPG